MKIVWLKGDYTKRFERQQQAQKENCTFVVSFHFNSATNPNAGGAEVYYSDERAMPIAERLLHTIVNVLKVKSRGIKAAEHSRARFICHYLCPAVLLEPCFISNVKEAILLHQLSRVRALGEAIANVLRTSLSSDACVGLDVGHLFKTSDPHDRGAYCVFSSDCNEARHSLQLAKVVAASLLNSHKTKGGNAA